VLIFEKIGHHQIRRISADFLNPGPDSIVFRCRPNVLPFFLKKLVHKFNYTVRNVTPFFFQTKNIYTCDGGHKFDSFCRHFAWFAPPPNRVAFLPSITSTRIQYSHNRWRMCSVLALAPPSCCVTEEMLPSTQGCN
jgi:hypothetical protein